MALLVFLGAGTSSVAGCGSSSSGAAEGPTSGRWIFSSSAIASNGCMLPEDELVPVGVFYVRNDGATFAIDADDGSGPVTCVPSSDGSFTCDSIDAGSLMPSANSRVDLVLDTGGTFRDPRAGTGFQELTGTCTGTDCSLASLLGLSFPCTSRVTYEVSWMSADLGPLAR